MDAMLKRRMWKVAITHFVLTLIVIAINLHKSGFSGPSGSIREEIYMIKETLKFGPLVLLQPQTGVLLAAFRFFPDTISHYFHWASTRTWMIVWFVSIPIWSLCFGWLFVKLDNWLNHFPVLGRKVF